MLRLNNSINDGGSGGGGGGGSTGNVGTRLYLPALRTLFDEHAFIQPLSENLKGNVNTDYYFSFCYSQNTNLDSGTLIDIAGVVMAQIDAALVSPNYGTSENDEILSNDYISTHRYEKIECWVNVDGTTRTWKYRLEGAAEWTAGPVITDSGINTESTDGNYIGNNHWEDNASQLLIGWDFRVVQNGTVVFDATTAVRGRDFEIGTSEGQQNIELKTLL